MLTATLFYSTQGGGLIEREETDDVLTIEELACYLKIPKSTLYKLVREGKIPSQKLVGIGVSGRCH